MNKKLLTIGMLALALVLCALPALAGDTDETDLATWAEWKALPLSGYTEAQIAEMEENLAERAEQWPTHGVPAEGEIRMAQALTIGNDTLKQSKGLTDETLGEFVMLPYFMTEDSWVNINGEPVTLTAPYWQMNYQGDAYYTVYIDAKTGAVLAIEGVEDTNG